MAIKIIIASGDSFTLGDELPGDLYIRDYTKILQSNPLANHYYRQLCSLTTENNDLYLEQCRKLSWPAKFSNMINVPVLNVAAQAASNQEIIRKAIYYSHQQIEEGIDPSEILCLIMFTLPIRYGIPNTNAGPVPFQTVHMSFENFYKNLSKGLKIISKNILSHYNEHDFYWDSFSHIISGIEYLKELGVNLHLFDCGYFLWSLSKDDCPINDERKNLKTIIKNIMTPKIEMSLTDYPLVQKTLPGGHLSEYMHDYFAEKIKEKIYDNLYSVAKPATS